MKKIINLETWSRKEYFDFYLNFEEPQHSIVAEVDCTKAYEFAKDKGYSFFAYYLYQSLKVVNEIEEFRYRIVDEQVVLFDTINGSTTIGRKDGSFGIGFAGYYNNFDEFQNVFAMEVERVNDATGFAFGKPRHSPDVIHYTSNPWVRFTGISNVRFKSSGDTIPKITFGKAIKENNRLIMPVSVSVYHGFVDGIHLGQFFKRFQELLNCE